MAFGKAVPKAKRKRGGSNLREPPPRLVDGDAIMRAGTGGDEPVGDEAEEQEGEETVAVECDYVAEQNGKTAEGQEKEGAVESHSTTETPRPSRARVPTEPIDPDHYTVPPTRRDRVSYIMRLMAKGVWERGVSSQVLAYAWDAPLSTVQTCAGEASQRVKDACDPERVKVRLMTALDGAIDRAESDPEAAKSATAVANVAKALMPLAGLGETRITIQHVVSQIGALPERELVGVLGSPRVAPLLVAHTDERVLASRDAYEAGSESVWMTAPLGEDREVTRARAREAGRAAAEAALEALDAEAVVVDAEIVEGGGR